MLRLRMLRRLPGSLLLLLLVFALFHTRPAWAGSDAEPTNVLVRVSPLTLLLENQVTIKVGDFTCELVYGADPSSVCSNLPPGEYEVSATLAGYIVAPPSYPLTIPDDTQGVTNGSVANGGVANGDAAASLDASRAESEFHFKFYQIENELFMPTVQVQP